MGESEMPLTTEAVQQALDTPVQVPDECICDYGTIMPYRLTQRVSNPNCTVHSGDDTGDLERERDE